MRTTVWNEEIADYTAELLFETGSYLVDFERPREDWFLWKSGIRAPSYCNCRFLNRSYEAYEACTNNLESIIQLKFSDDIQAIVGLATAGVSWAARIAARLALPLSFVRTIPKQYGVGKLIEGNPERGIKAVIIDDLCGSGETVYKAIKALEWEFQIETLGFVTITNWCFESMWEKFDSMDIGIYSLTSYPNLLKVGVEKNYLTEEQASMLREFYQSPWTYQWDLLKKEQK